MPAGNVLGVFVAALTVAMIPSIIPIHKSSRTIDDNTLVQFHRIKQPPCHPTHNQARAVEYRRNSIEHRELFDLCTTTSTPPL